MSEAPQSNSGPQHSPAPSEQSAAWAQFPRRAIFLLIAFGIWSLFITGLRTPLLVGASALPQDQVNWELSWRFNQPVTDVITARIPNTLLLLGAAFGLALLLAIALAFFGTLIHRLEQATGQLGSILKGLGRVGCLIPAALPVTVLSLFFISYFSFRVGLLPPAGKMSPQVSGATSLSDSIQHLILPSSTLALMMGVMAAQTMAREMTLFQASSSTRLWLTRLFKLLGLLLGQVGGWLTASIVVEIVFSWPGLGRIAFDAAVTGDYPVLLGILGTFASIILAARLAAELFHWLERLVRIRIPDLSPQVTSSPWHRTAHKVWVVITLLLLIVPLGFAVAGLTVDPTQALETDIRARNAQPSADHPWGTDSMGRDLQARVMSGGLTTLKIAALAAAIAFIPALVGGTLTGFLVSRGKLWTESLADLLLLPADVLMFTPAVAGLMVFMLIDLPEGGNWLWLTFGVVAVLLPRALRVYQALWTSAPETRKWLVLGLFGSGALLLGMVFAGFGLVIAVDFLGLGIQPPQPSFGNVLSDQVRYLASLPAGLYAAGYAIWGCAAAFYLSADALVGFFNSKEPLARLNE